MPSVPQQNASIPITALQLHVKQHLFRYRPFSSASVAAAATLNRLDGGVLRASVLTNEVTDKLSDNEALVLDCDFQTPISLLLKQL